MPFVRQITRVVLEIGSIAIAYLVCPKQFVDNYQNKTLSLLEELCNVGIWNSTATRARLPRFCEICRTMNLKISKLFLKTGLIYLEFGNLASPSVPTLFFVYLFLFPFHCFRQLYSQIFPILLKNKRDFKIV